jgi:hypothetical protein
VTVAGGSTVSAPFTISTTAVAALTHMSIKASDGANQETATLTARPAALTAVRLSPGTVVGGKSTTNNIVTLNGQAPSAGAVVTLLSNDPTVATVPVSVTVSAGATVSPVFYHHDHCGCRADSRNNLWNLQRRDQERDLDRQLAAVGVVEVVAVEREERKFHDAQHGGAKWSGDASVATPPTTVTVAAGATSATFTITTTAVTPSTVVPITASFGGTAETANLTVTP